MPTPKLTAVLDRVGRLAAIALGFSIPISTAADSVLLAVVAGCYLAAGRYREALAWRANAVYVACLVLFGAFVAGTFYGPAPLAEAGRYLVKYADLLFVPIIGAYFHDPAARRRGLAALAAAIAVTLLLSSVLHAGAVPRTGLFVENSMYPVVFKQSLTHTILMAFGAFLFAQLGVAAESRALRWLCYAVAVAMVLNTIFVVPGRTGYVVLGALALYFGYAWLRWKGVAIMIAGTALAFALAYGASPLFQQRIDRAVQEYSSWKPDVAAGEGDAVGLRLEFYRNSLAIVRDHPVIGVGTGGFSEAYGKLVAGTGQLSSRNPHNEYLLVAAQLGIVGLALMLYLFYAQWRQAPRLASPLETHVARALVLTIAIGCLFNSLLLDHTEGLLFAWLTGLLYAGLKSNREP